MSSFYFPKEILKLAAKRLAEWKTERRTALNEIQKKGFGSPEELARFYVEPDCQQHNPADHGNDEPESYLRMPILTSMSRFFAKEYSGPPDGRNQMFVLADAGMGKTSLLIMLWLTSKLSFWPSTDRCVLLKLGADTLEDIETFDGSPEHTIVLLDSLDEDPTAFERIEERVTELLQATESFKRVVITCRTQFFPDGASDPFSRPGLVEIANYSCPVIFLSLFDDEHVDAYIRKRFPKSFVDKIRRRESAKYLAAQGTLTKMRSLRLRPLLLSHIEDLLDSDTSDSWTIQTVYAALIRVWLRREVRTLNKAGISVPFEDLFEACLQVARNLEESRRDALPLDELHMLELQVGRPADAPILPLISGRTLLNKKSDGQFRFSHRSIQEFLYSEFVFERADSRLPGVVTSDLVLEFLRYRNFHTTLDELRAGMSSFRRSVASADVSLIDRAEGFVIPIDHEIAFVDGILVASGLLRGYKEGLTRGGFGILVNGSAPIVMTISDAKKYSRIVKNSAFEMFVAPLTEPYLLANMGACVTTSFSSMPIEVDDEMPLQLATDRVSTTIGLIGAQFAESLAALQSTPPEVAAPRVVNRAYPLHSVRAGLDQISLDYMHQARPALIVARLS